VNRPGFSGGADIPAFELSTVFPSPVEAIAPDFTQAGPMAVDRNAPLVMQWAPTEERIWMFAVEYTLSSEWDRREAWCVFDGAAGSGTMPAEVLQQLNVSDASHLAGVGMYHYRERCYALGQTHIAVTAGEGPFIDAELQ
jgi:hypothetical protein